MIIEFDPKYKHQINHIFNYNYGNIVKKSIIKTIKNSFIMGSIPNCFNDSVFKPFLYSEPNMFIKSVDKYIRKRIAKAFYDVITYSVDAKIWIPISNNVFDNVKNPIYNSVYERFWI